MFMLTPVLQQQSFSKSFWKIKAHYASSESVHFVRTTFRLPTLIAGDTGAFWGP